MSSPMEDIIDTLEKLGSTRQNNHRSDQENGQLNGQLNGQQNGQQNNQDTDYETTIKENRTMCRLINIHLGDFFDDIHIPYDFFKDGGWKISKILNNNEDILFYNKKYLVKEDEERFFEVFDKYISMIEEILTPSNKLFTFLKKWTDMSQYRWKPTTTGSYLKSLLVNRKYQCISPAYTANIYYNTSAKYKHDREKIKPEIESHLSEIIKDVKKEIKIFKIKYNEIITAYVYECPFDTKEKNYYDLAFINSILLEIFNFAEKLIDLNVYALHPIINDIIGYYTPLDDINYYKSSEYDKKNIYLV